MRNFTARETEREYKQRSKIPGNRGSYSVGSGERVLEPRGESGSARAARRAGMDGATPVVGEVRGMRWPRALAQSVALELRSNQQRSRERYM